jgi:hypothetical protein
LDRTSLGYLLDCFSWRQFDPYRCSTVCPTPSSLRLTLEGHPACQAINIHQGRYPHTGAPLCTARTTSRQGTRPAPPPWPSRPAQRCPGQSRMPERHEGGAIEHRQYSCTLPMQRPPQASPLADRASQNSGLGYGTALRLSADRPVAWHGQWMTSEMMAAAPPAIVAAPVAIPNFSASVRCRHHPMRPL